MACRECATTYVYDIDSRCIPAEVDFHMSSADPVQVKGNLLTEQITDEERVFINIIFRQDMEG